MKIAITSTGDTLDSTIDQRFGRCSYFFLFDTESSSIEILPNPGKQAEEGSGPAAVQFLASKSVGKVVSGEFGMKIKPLLDRLQIQMIIITDPEKKIRDITEMLKHTKQ